MKRLISNQNVTIDNHYAGIEIKGLDGLHIHKRMNGNDKRFGKAEIKIPLDGQASVWKTEGETGERLHKEIREILEDTQKVSIFAKDIKKQLERYKPDLSSEEFLDIANHILKSFGVQAYLFRTMDYRNEYGQSVTYEVTSKDDRYIYLVRLKNDYVYIKGETR